MKPANKVVAMVINGGGATIDNPRGTYEWSTTENAEYPAGMNGPSDYPLEVAVSP